ncbi:MAG: SMR family transporter [Bacteroidales bacterium]
MRKAWFFLSLAIFSEVAGSLFMKWNQLQDSSHQWIFYLLIILSYILLSGAVKKIPIAVAFASWEGAGLLLISVVSYFLFDEHLSLLQIGGIVLAAVGILLINFDA